MRLRGGRLSDLVGGKQNKRQVGVDDDLVGIVALERKMVCTIGFSVIGNGGGEDVEDL